jgi:hypothetical protein
MPPADVAADLALFIGCPAQDIIPQRLVDGFRLADPYLRDRRGEGEQDVPLDLEIYRHDRMPPDWW